MRRLNQKSEEERSNLVPMSEFEEQDGFSIVDPDDPDGYAAGETDFGSSSQETLYLQDDEDDDLDYLDDDDDDDFDDDLDDDLDDDDDDELDDDDFDDDDDDF